MATKGTLYQGSTELYPKTTVSQILDEATSESTAESTSTLVDGSRFLRSDTQNLSLAQQEQVRVNTQTGFQYEYYDWCTISEETTSMAKKVLQLCAIPIGTTSTSPNQKGFVSIQINAARHKSAIKDECAESCYLLICITHSSISKEDTRQIPYIVVNLFNDPTGYFTNKISYNITNTEIVPTSNDSSITVLTNNSTIDIYFSELYNYDSFSMHYHRFYRYTPSSENHQVFGPVNNGHLWTQCDTQVSGFLHPTNMSTNSALTISLAKDNTFQTTLLSNASSSGSPATTFIQKLLAKTDDFIQPLAQNDTFQTKLLTKTTGNDGYSLITKLLADTTNFITPLSQDATLISTLGHNSDFQDCLLTSTSGASPYSLITKLLAASDTFITPLAGSTTFQNALLGSTTTTSTNFLTKLLSNTTFTTNFCPSLTIGQKNGEGSAVSLTFGNKYRLYFDGYSVTTGTETLQEIEYHTITIKKFGTCLHGDTNILMYDHSTKKLKDIQVGDILLGRNGNPTIVLECQQRGEDETFQRFIYSNDKEAEEIYMYQAHQIYSVNKKLPVLMQTMIPGSSLVLNSNNETLTFIDKSMHTFYGETAHYYELCTSDGTYYGNNLLFAIEPTGQFRRLTLPYKAVDKFNTLMDEYLNIIKQYDNTEPVSTLVLPQGKVSKLTTKMNSIKNKLKDMDYIDIKYLEGKITEIEFKSMVALKEELRAEYATLETEYATAKTELAQAEASCKVDSVAQYNASYNYTVNHYDDFVECVRLMKEYKEKEWN